MPLHKYQMEPFMHFKVGRQLERRRFLGDYFWRLVKYNANEDYYPNKISDVWNITGPIDAAMTNSNGHTYIFKVSGGVTG